MKIKFYYFFIQGWEVDVACFGSHHMVDERAFDFGS